MANVNDYDAVAAKRQERLKKGENLAHRFVEKPAMKKMLPDLKGQTVLMLGCGTGEESNLLVDKGATEIIGIDLSEVSIKLAQEAFPEHTFQVGDINNLKFDDDTFDFVYSSLAVDYTAYPLGVYKEVARVLKANGVFQFSVPHPVRWSSEKVDINGVPSRLLGFAESIEQPRVYGNYSDYQEHTHSFLLSSDDPISIWVGPPSMHFNMLKQAGFQIEEFVETRAIEEAKEVDDYYYERFSKLPQFTIFQAIKN